MSNTLTIITWNVNKASVNRCNFWFKLLEIDFDVAAIQEVRVIPRFMKNFFEVIKRSLYIDKKCRIGPTVRDKIRKASKNTLIF